MDQQVVQNKHLYQVGNQRLYMLRTSLADEPELQGRGESTELLYSPYPVWGNSRYLHQSVELEVSGLLVDTSSQRAKQIAQAIRRMIDMPTNLIAYEPDTNLTWLHTIGVVHEVQLEQNDPWEPAGLRLQMELMPYWEPLNRQLWVYGSTPQSPLDPTTPPLVHRLPNWPGTGRVFNPRYADTEMWIRQNYEDFTFLYNPLNWELDDPAFQGIAWTASNWFTLDTDENIWNAPPRMLYGFTHLPTSGQVQIQVLRQQIWNREEELITVDLDQLDADLTPDYGGLQIHDVLVIGDVPRKPGVIVRGGQLLEFSPAVDYRDMWPGFLAPGRNRFFLDAAGGMCAYLAVRRKL